MDQIPLSEAKFLPWLEPYMDQRMVPPKPGDAKKYSDAQPRAADGKWTAGGGFDGGKVTGDTMSKYHAGIAWDPGRVESVHTPIISKTAAGVPPATGKQTLYMTGGGYGSGKSTLLDRFPNVVGMPTVAKGDELANAYRGLGPAPGGAAVRSDPDAIKAGIPEYQQMASGETPDKNAATYVHEESSDIAKTIVASALASGKDVVYDTSADTNPDKLSAKVQGFRDTAAATGNPNLQVNAAYAWPGSVDEAQARADARAANSEGLRRYVDPAVLSENHSLVATCWLSSAARGTFDNLSLWSTAGAFGSPPTLVASAAGGVTTVHDPESFARFTAIARKG